MYRRTGNFFGINEALFSSALAAMVFSILAAQPLTIVGVTGLIALFNYTIYDIVTRYDSTIYPQFMAWVGIWAAISHWIIALGNYCDYMAYVTDFSSEAFGMYVGIIYISMYTPTLAYPALTHACSQGCGRTCLSFRNFRLRWRLSILHSGHPLLRLSLWT